VQPACNQTENCAATPANDTQLISSRKYTAANERDKIVKLSRIAATVATLAIAAIVSGCGVTHHSATAARTTPAHTAATATAHLLAATPAATPAMVWLGSAGGQAQVTLNDDVDTLAAALEVENYSPTVANLLQPGPGYGTTPQDDTAWNTALAASNITVS